jgi:RimJ/RimL family protein N-acetyltransferase
MLPFTTRLIGMTTYMNIDAATPRVEIGSTWNAASSHGTGTNPDSKLLLLRHAFETLGCPAVEFRTHWLNHQSREAIARLGAKQDGVLRSHTRTADGQLRDTVVFSILEHEWPMVRASLEFRLAKQR